MVLKMERERRGLVVRALVALPALWAALSLAAPAPPAGASIPCWRSVVDDWADRGIDREHPLRCYRSALKRLPSDIRTYTTAEDDIQRALLEAIRSVRPAEADGEKSATSPSRAERARESSARTLQGRKAQAVGGVVATSMPAAATSPPLRVILGASFALLLVLLGGIGKYRVSRRTDDPTTSGG
jgi:hypothetical protein